MSHGEWWHVGPPLTCITCIFKLKQRTTVDFSSFPQYFQYISNFMSQITLFVCGMWLFDLFFFHKSANLICRFFFYPSPYHKQNAFAHTYHTQTGKCSRQQDWDPPTPTTGLCGIDQQGHYFRGTGEQKSKNEGNRRTNAIFGNREQRKQNILIWRKKGKCRFISGEQGSSSPPPPT